MNSRRYAEPLRTEAIREMGWYTQAGGEPVRLFGLPAPAPYACIRHHAEPRDLLAQIDDLRNEVRRLQSELQHTAEERDILRNGHRILCLTLTTQKRRKTAPRKSRAHADTAAAATPQDLPEVAVALKPVS